jgi:hypothetical protein
MSVLAFHLCHAPCLPLGPPPGVLTGLPLVMFEARPTLDMCAVPEQWLENDVSIIEEMMEMIETERVKTIDDEMNEIQFQLTRFERYQDQTAYYVYPMTWKNGGITTLYEFTAFGIKDALEQFEEDFDYELSLKEESIKNDEINLHRLLASPPEDRVGWCGNSNWRSNADGFVFSALLNERYRFPALQITHPFPEDRRGYALAQSVYGKVYIPEKFRNFIPAPGQWIDATVALQDVEGKGGKANTFRFSAIFMHTDNLGIQ